MVERPLDTLPLRLHRAASIIARSGDEHAADAQSACAEIAARIILLEEALLSLVRGETGAMDAARRLLGVARKG